IDIIGGRINFINPLTGEEVKGNNKGSMVAVFDPFVEGIVTRQMPLDKIKELGGYEK
ncbi:adenine methyltransferase, partial [Mannheimia haemolytica]